MLKRALIALLLILASCGEETGVFPYTANLSDTEFKETCVAVIKKQRSVIMNPTNALYVKKTEDISPTIEYRTSYTRVQFDLLANPGQFGPFYTVTKGYCAQLIDTGRLTMYIKPTSEQIGTNEFNDYKIVY
jgi:hypothetical protein